MIACTVEPVRRACSIAHRKACFEGADPSTPTTIRRTDPAVTRGIEHLIRVAHANHRKVGLCGQRPSDDPSFATFLVVAGIDSISVAPDSLIRVKQYMAKAERSP